MVFGVRAEKDRINVVIIDGTREEPTYKDEKRLNITISVPKTADSRGEELSGLKRDFDELLKKFKPDFVAIKDAESSQHSKVQPNILRGEVEGMIILTCYQNCIETERLLYTQIKSKLPLQGRERSKEFLYGELEKKFDAIKISDKHKDALLSAWAVLNE